MNIADIVILALIVLAVVFAVRYMIKSSKKGATPIALLCLLLKLNQISKVNCFCNLCTKNP